MDLTSPAVLRKLLERHGLAPRKRWGQHFLISSSVVDSIVGRLVEMSGVLEVGPGPGVLTTRVLAMQPRPTLSAVEIDPIAVSALHEVVPDAKIFRADVLETDLGPILRELPRPRAILSNMPYNITGPLLHRFSELHEDWDRAVLMMQREVGDRIMAPAGSSDFDSLSVAMQTRFQVSKVCAVSKGAFYPPPKVDSVVLEFTPRAEMPPEEFFAFVRSGFTQPRKTLANNLVASGLPRERVVAALAALGLDEKVRPHQLDLPTWRRAWSAFRT